MRELWRANQKLNASFLLLTIEEASNNGLFGPDPPLRKVRPRMGDFVAISLNQKTLVSPRELSKHRHRCQGSHGSLLAAEMEIPFVLCTPETAP